MTTIRFQKSTRNDSDTVEQFGVDFSMTEKIKDGPHKVYYDNGQLQSEGTYKDGELIDSKEY